MLDSAKLKSKFSFARSRNTLRYDHQTVKVPAPPAGFISERCWRALNGIEKFCSLIHDLANEPKTGTIDRVQWKMLSFS